MCSSHQLGKKKQQNYFYTGTVTRRHLVGLSILLFSLHFSDKHVRIQMTVVCLLKNNKKHSILPITEIV